MGGCDNMFTRLHMVTVTIGTIISNLGISLEYRHHMGTR